MTRRLALLATEPMRLDRFLCNSLPHLSRRHILTVLGRGDVFVNGQKSRKGRPLAPGDRVSVDARLVETLTLRPQAELSLPILFADEDLVALDKPCDMPSIAQRVTDLGTAANFLVARFPETASITAYGIESGIAHRLDTATSGVLVGARTRRAYEELRRGFSEHKIRKTYVAIVRGHIDSPGQITDALQDSAISGSVEVAPPHSKKPSRAAITRYTPIGSTESASYSKVEITIETGVRHQIRAHMASIGHPIIGDRLYGEPTSASMRLLLHATRVALEHPRSGIAMTIDSPTPADFFDIPA